MTVTLRGDIDGAKFQQILSIFWQIESSAWIAPALMFQNVTETARPHLMHTFFDFIESFNNNITQDWTQAD